MFSAQWRTALAMLVAPARGSRLMAKLRKVAIM